MPLYIAKSGDLEGCHACLTDRLTTSKDRATQLLIRYKSGALVTQLQYKNSDEGKTQKCVKDINKASYIEDNLVKATKLCGILSTSKN